MNGIITKGIGGFYYVEAEDSVRYECKARGIFRKDKISPAAGDRVIIDAEQTIVEILPRKNYFIRPPLANLDKLFIIISSCDPVPSYLVIDKLIAISEQKGIEPIIVLTKADLKGTDEIYDIYKKAGFTVVYNISDIPLILQNMTGAFIGNTGVGKSTLLNRLFLELSQTTSHTSQKLGRGRHTTREVELFYIKEINAYIADTPGFSTIETGRYDILLKENIANLFRDFAPYKDKCKFTGCDHTSSKNCEVAKAVEAGFIGKTRFASYINMYNEAKAIKHWEIRS